MDKLGIKTVHVCTDCGKFNENLNLLEGNCQLHAQECYADSLRLNNNRVAFARALRPSLVTLEK